MLALFPALLSFSFLAIALLRISAAIAFFYDAYCLFAKRKEVAHTKVPFLGRIPQGFVVFGSLVALVIAIMFAVGIYTQAAAIVGMLITLKYLAVWKKYRALIPFSLGTSALLFIICLFLLLSGAGPFAFDLPL